LRIVVSFCSAVSPIWPKKEGTRRLGSTTRFVAGDLTGPVEFPGAGSWAGSAIVPEATTAANTNPNANALVRLRMLIVGFYPFQFVALARRSTSVSRWITEPLQL
jgi:hypothetical protein